MNRHYLLDLSTAIQKRIVRAIGKKSPVLCPLFPDGDIDEGKCPANIAKDVARLGEIERLLNELWSTPAGLDAYCQSLGPSFSYDESLVQGLNSYSLLEALVAAKVLQVFVLRARGPSDLLYLEENKGKLGILPGSLPRLYTLARDLYYHNVGRSFGTTKDDTNLSWPLDYSNSACSLADLGLLFLADVALHVPPFFYITDRIAKKKNSIEDFVPAYRFCKAVAWISERGGFPPDNRAEYADYYVNFFNSIAKSVAPAWPTLEETNQAWLQLVARAKKSRRESTDGYCHRLLLERATNPTQLVLFHPLIPCGKEQIPVFHLTPNSFKILRITIGSSGIFLHPFDMLGLNAYEILRANRPLWKDTRVDGRQSKHDVQDETNNVNLFLQETVYRSLCNELHTAMLYKGSFTCPFHSRACDSASPQCADVKSLREIPRKRCSLRDYLAQDRIDPDRIQWV